MSTNQSHVLILQERNSGNTPQFQYTRGLDLSGTIEGAGGIGGLISSSGTLAGANTMRFSSKPAILSATGAYVPPVMLSVSPRPKD